MPRMWETDGRRYIATGEYQEFLNLIYILLDCDHYKFSGIAISFLCARKSTDTHEKMKLTSRAGTFGYNLDKANNIFITSE